MADFQGCRQAGTFSVPLPWGKRYSLGPGRGLASHGSSSRHNPGTSPGPLVLRGLEREGFAEIHYDGLCSYFPQPPAVPKS